MAADGRRHILAVGGFSIACDDGTAAHFIGAEFAGVVADGPGVTGYRVSPDGTGRAREDPLPVSVQLG